MEMTRVDFQQFLWTGSKRETRPPALAVGRRSPTATRPGAVVRRAPVYDVW